MFRQTGNSDPGPSATGEVLVTGGGGGGSTTADQGAAGSSPWLVKSIAGTATLSNVNDTNVSTTLLALNANRLGASVFNDSDQTLYLKLGTTASATSFTVKMTTGAYYELPVPVYTGRIDGIWVADSTGAARVTELT